MSASSSTSTVRPFDCTTEMSNGDAVSSSISMSMICPSPRHRRSDQRVDGVGVENGLAERCHRRSAASVDTTSAVPSAVTRTSVSSPAARLELHVPAAVAIGLDADRIALGRSAAAAMMSVSSVGGLGADRSADRRGRRRRRRHPTRRLRCAVVVIVVHLVGDRGADGDSAAGEQRGGEHEPPAMSQVRVRERRGCRATDRRSSGLRGGWSCRECGRGGCCCQS